MGLFDSAASSLPDGWQELNDEYGTFYFNPATDVTTRVRPSAEATSWNPQASYSDPSAYVNDLNKAAIVSADSLGGVLNNSAVSSFQSPIHSGAFGSDPFTTNWSQKASTTYTPEQAIALFNAQDPALFNDPAMVSNLSNATNYFTSEGKFAPGSSIANSDVLNQALTQWEKDRAPNLLDKIAPYVPLALLGAGLAGVGSGIEGASSGFGAGGGAGGAGLTEAEQIAAAWADAGVPMTADEVLAYQAAGGSGIGATTGGGLLNAAGDLYGSDLVGLGGEGTGASTGFLTAGEATGAANAAGVGPLAGSSALWGINGIGSGAGQIGGGITSGAIDSGIAGGAAGSSGVNPVVAGVTNATPEQIAATWTANGVPTTAGQIAAATAAGGSGIGATVGGGLASALSGLTAQQIAAGAGGLLAAASTPSSGTKTTTQVPWSEQQPYLKDLFEKAKTLSNKPVDTSLTNAASQTMKDILARNPNADAQTNPYLGKVTNVGTNPYLGMDNPYLQKMIDYASQDISNAWLPQTQRLQRQSGAWGNSGLDEQRQRELLAAQARSADTLRFQDYTNQQNLSEADIARRLQAEQGDLARNATLFNTDATRNLAAYQFNTGQQQTVAQNAPTFQSGVNENLWSGVNNYGKAVSGNYGGTTSTPYSANPLASGLAGAALGYNLFKGS